MKKFLVSLAIVGSLATLPGCAVVTSWWDQFKSNPVEQVQVFEQGVAVAISDATVAFQVVKEFLPASVQVEAQNAFNAAMITLNNAEAALNAAVQAAVDAQQPNPDFSALISDVTTAVQSVIAIINQYKAAPPAPASATAAFGPRPSEPVGLAQAQAVLATLQRFGGKPAQAKK